ncbi:MAG: FlgD immunoglobulin-like domain containing protein [candidate division WOR-3 bacterium]
MRGLALLAVAAGLALAQSYRCDWQVVATGGGMMSSDYRCGATIGQTATGRMSGQNLLTLIGFWQPSGVTGIQERELSQEGITPLVTRLYQPVPNPFIRAVIIRYSLGQERAASLLVCDLSGRLVRTLVNSSQRPGTYTLHWNGKDNLGRAVPNGVYFCRFEAGDYRQTFKLLLQR